MRTTMKQLIAEDRRVHVLYSYNEMEKYIKEITDYIEEGIINSEYIMLIENDRIYSMIHKELSSKLNKKQLSFIHRINNFDFYYSSGSYHPPAIYNYFNKAVQPYLNRQNKFRAWAHVEWATIEEPYFLIEDFERIVDESVHLLGFPLICAYEGEKMPDNLVTILNETHPYKLREDGIILSKNYRPIFK